MGVAVFGEQVRDGVWIIAQVGGAALVAGCTVLLARSPLLQGSEGKTEDAPDQERDHAGATRER
jgi:hypothetical protein